ncbi:Uncharacterised protein [Mycobacterium tuberculosis]|nr:Uncharacterised protein [Mycobacterium tuberculosis]
MKSMGGISIFERVMGPKLMKLPLFFRADSRVASGAVKPTVTTPLMPMWMAGMGMSGTVKL